MKRIIASLIIGLVMFTNSTAGAEPVRRTVRPGETATVVNPSDTFCWNLTHAPSGRLVAIVKDGTRAYRGAPCTGQRILRVRLSMGTQEDDIEVGQLGDILWLAVS